MAVSKRKAAPADIAGAELLALDMDDKLKLLEAVTQELLSKRLEFARLSGEYAALKADIGVLTEVKSALQSALRVEGLL